MKAKYNTTSKVESLPESFTCYVELQGLPILVIILPNNGEMLTPRLQTICKEHYPDCQFITWWMADLD